MIKATFKTDLQTIYTETNKRVRNYKATESRTARTFIITDLIELTEQLVKNNVRKFINLHTVTELTADDLYSIAISDSLLSCIDWFTFEKGNNFMPMWDFIMKRDFKHALQRERFGKASKEKGAFSLDEVSEGTNGAETKASWFRVEDNCCETVVAGDLMSLIKRFSELDKHGKVMLALTLMNDTEARKKALAKAVELDEYNQTAWKRVQRAKDRFAKFLIEENFEVPEYITKRIK